MRTYEDVLNEVGGWGRYQKWMCFLLTLSAVPNGYFTMIIVFSNKTPEHRCRILELDGTVANGSTLSPYNVSDLHLYIPWDNKNDRFDRCSRYITTNQTLNDTSPDSKTTTCDHGYIYNIVEGERTAVTEWDLVCDRAPIKPQIASLYMCGILVGSILSGIVSDWLGRWPVIIFGTYFQFIFMILNFFCVSPSMYAAMMFFAGGCSLINFMAAVVLGAELIDMDHRALMETAIMNGFAIGYMILPLFAYFILDWKMLMLATGLTGVIFIPYWWLIPESPRWLVIKQKYKKANAIMKNIAKWNNVKVEDGAFFSEENIELIPKQKRNLQTNDDVLTTTTGRRCHMIHRIPYMALVLKPGMLRRTVCTCSLWMVIALIYYTMNLNTGNLGGDDIINCFISACVEIPAYTCVYFFLWNRGRRWLMMALMTMAAVLGIMTPFLNRWNTIAGITSAMAGKFFVTSAFSLVYLYTSELFPTEGRNQALGATSVCARIGSILAPYIIFIVAILLYVLFRYTGDEISGDIPYFITGTLAFVSAFVSFLLPETQGQPLPDTYEEAYKLKRQSWTCSLPCKKSTVSNNEKKVQLTPEV